MGGATIDLLVIGVSHRTAPVARARAAGRRAGRDRRARCAELTALPAVREAAMLSTCNRVELYVAADDARRAAARRWPSVLARRAGVAGRRARRRTSISAATRRPSATCSASPPASIRWWWASRRSWARPSRRYDARRPARHGRRRPAAPASRRRVPGRAPRAARDRDRAQPGVGQLGGGRVRAPGVRRLRRAAGCWWSAPARCPSWRRARCARTARR